MHSTKAWFGTVVFTLIFSTSLFAQRMMENLNRGVVAINQGPVFREADVADVQALATKLRAHNDPFSNFLFGRLSEYSLQALSNGTISSQALTALLVTDLNVTLQQG